MFAIVDKYGKSLWLYCYDKLKNKELTDETLNDILTVLWKKWDRVDVDDHIKAYLYRIADFCIKHNRGKNAKYYERHESYENVADSFESISYTDLYFSDKPEEESHNMLVIKKKLDSDYQEIFEYRYIQKKTIEEIVSIMNIPYSTLRYRLQKMNRMIRAIIEKTF